jgi:hypothetical protein
MGCMESHGPLLREEAAGSCLRMLRSLAMDCLERFDHS